MVVCRPRYVISVALVTFLLIGAVSSLASPPPRPVCSACGDGFVESAKEHGISVAVEHSTAIVRVHENGSATWIIRNRIDDDSAERLRTNPTLLSIIAQGARNGRLLSTDISADVVVTIRYRMNEFAVPSVGNVLRSDYFTEFSYRNYAGLGADHLTVIAPEGMHIGSAMPGATTDGRRMTVTSYADSAFITFVPRGAFAGPVVSFLAIATVTVPLVIRNVLVFVGIPLVIFTAVIGIMARGLTHIDRKLPRVYPYSVPIIIALGLLAYLLSLGNRFVLFGYASLLFGVGSGLTLFGAAIWVIAARDRVTYWTLTGSAVLAVVVATVTTEGIIFPLYLPMFALIPTGYSLGQDDLCQSVATGVVAFAAALAFVAPLDSTTIGLSFLFVLVGGMYALVVAFLGSPLLVIGASLSTHGK